MRPEDREALAWEKQSGLLPAVVQDADTHRVLLLGFMNREALETTLATGRVTFWSRSRKELWTKGDTSGHTLAFVRIETDCDRDALLVQARPAGPTCHLGRRSCFQDAPGSFLSDLDKLVAARSVERPEGSYTTRLFNDGTKRIAQKVGEEGVETALAAVGEDDAGLIGESADLIYHLTVLLRSRGLSMSAVVEALAKRHAS